MKTLYPEIKRISNPHRYYVDLSEKLLNLKNKMIVEINSGEIPEEALKNFADKVDINKLVTLKNLE